ncbi:hypothetical protein ACU4GD_27935 [Cupriavidus basilensis]
MDELIMLGAVASMLVVIIGSIVRGCCHEVQAWRSRLYRAATHTPRTSGAWCASSGPRSGEERPRVGLRVLRRAAARAGSCAAVGFAVDVRFDCYDADLRPISGVPVEDEVCDEVAA